jgi:hypothetical protein
MAEETNQTNVNVAFQNGLREMMGLGKICL